MCIRDRDILCTYHEYRTHKYSINRHIYNHRHFHTNTMILWWHILSKMKFNPSNVWNNRNDYATTLQLMIILKEYQVCYKILSVIFCRNFCKIVFHLKKVFIALKRKSHANENFFGKYLDPHYYFNPLIPKSTPVFKCRLNSYLWIN